MNDDLINDIFSESDSDGNIKRERLEQAMLMAAAELMSHCGASKTTQAGYGVEVTITIHGEH